MPDFIPDNTLDFHQFGPLLEYDIEKTLSDFLEDCYIAGNRQVLVVTGKGRVVRPLVEKLLKHNSYVARFQSAGYYNGQQGAFEIFLKSD